MPATTYLVNALLDHALGGPSYTRPVTVKFALYKVAPTIAGGGTAITGSGYAEVSKTNDATLWPAASVSKATIPAVNFGVLGTPIETIVAIGIKEPGGTLIFFAENDVDGNPISITPVAGLATQIPAGQFVVEFIPDAA